MIKHINKDEILKLRQRLCEIVRFKNLISKKEKEIEDFFGIKLSLEQAIKLYEMILNTSLLNDVYGNLNDTMVQYLKNYNILDDDTFESLEKYTFDYRKKYSDEEYEEKCDELSDMDEVEESIKDILISVGEKCGIEVSSAKYTEIVFQDDDIDDGFNLLKESCIEIYEEYQDSDDPYSEFIDSFGENATVHVFKGVHISEKRINQINGSIAPKYGGFMTEVFTKGDNTFFTISDSHYSDVVGKELLLMVICSLIQIGGKYDN